jgi:hypothetical protein
VARRRHDVALAGSADGDRLAAEIRVVPLFDRRAAAGGKGDPGGNGA